MAGPVMLGSPITYHCIEKQLQGWGTVGSADRLDTSASAADAIMDRLKAWWKKVVAADERSHPVPRDAGAAYAVADSAEPAVTNGKQQQANGVEANGLVQPEGRPKRPAVEQQPQQQQQAPPKQQQAPDAQQPAPAPQKVRRRGSGRGPTHGLGPDLTDRAPSTRSPSPLARSSRSSSRRGGERHRATQSAR
jgi:hypothetical protein